MKNYSKKQILEAIQYWEEALSEAEPYNAELVEKLEEDLMKTITSKPYLVFCLLKHLHSYDSKVFDDFTRHIRNTIKPNDEVILLEQTKKYVIANKNKPIKRK